MKPSDLQNAELDFWVAKALDLTNPQIIDGHCTFDIFNGAMKDYFCPSTNWLFCGDLIQEFNLIIMKNPDKEIWGAASGVDVTQQGETPQIAICRCVIELKLGKELT